MMKFCSIITFCLIVNSIESLEVSLKVASSKSIELSWTFDAKENLTHNNTTLDVTVTPVLVEDTNNVQHFKISANNSQPKKIGGLTPGGRYILNIKLSSRNKFVTAETKTWFTTKPNPPKLIPDCSPTENNITVRWVDTNETNIFDKYLFRVESKKLKEKTQTVNKSQIYSGSNYIVFDIIKPDEEYTIYGSALKYKSKFDDYNFPEVRSDIVRIRCKTLSHDFDNSERLFSTTKSYQMSKLTSPLNDTRNGTIETNLNSSSEVLAETQIKITPIMIILIILVVVLFVSPSYAWFYIYKQKQLKRKINPEPTHLSQNSNETNSDLEQGQLELLELATREDQQETSEINQSYPLINYEQEQLQNLLEKEQINVQPLIISNISNQHHIIEPRFSNLIENSLIEIIGFIGQGNYGEVYFGIFKNETVAIKMSNSIRSIYQNDLDKRQLFNEAFIMKNFNHPNVLKLIGISFKSNGSPLVILPFMKNGDLLKYIRNPENTPTVKQLIRFAIDVAKGMEYLSDQHIIHRDLSARNCLLDDDMNAMVADFGLTKNQEYYRTQTSCQKMPIKWLAIESLENGVYDKKTDVWSYGVFVWELMTRGKTPYTNVPNGELLCKLQNGYRLSRPPYCPQLVFTLLGECWSSNPDSRPFFSEISQRLEHIVIILDKQHSKNSQCLNKNV